MLELDQILAKVNQRVTDIRNRTGAIGATQNATEGKDRLFGSDGNDLIDGLGGNDQIFGDFGDDVLQGNSGDDLITGGFGNDYLLGGDANDRLFGDFGDDLIFGENGNDLLSGSAGSDVIFGGAGNDSLLGGINGELDAPEGFFEDFLVGGSGSDNLNAFGGGKGNIERDVLVGGGEVDANGSITSFTPDGVRDTFVLANATGAFYTTAGGDDYAVIFDFEPGIDKLQLKSGVTYGFSGDNQSFFATSNGSQDLVAIFAGGVNLSGTDITFV
jgi:Ca2+-binding RTX toxin-like protein